MKDRFIDHPSGKLSAKEIGVKFEELNNHATTVGQFAVRACELAYGVPRLEQVTNLGTQRLPLPLRVAANPNYRTGGNAEFYHTLHGEAVVAVREITLGSNGNLAAPPKNASVVYDTESGLAIVTATDGESHLYPRRASEHAPSSPVLEELVRRAASRALSNYLLHKTPAKKSVTPLSEYL